MKRQFSKELIGWQTPEGTGEKRSKLNLQFAESILNSVTFKTLLSRTRSTFEIAMLLPREKDSRRPRPTICANSPVPRYRLRGKSADSPTSPL
jgi:hypothetical protein